MSFKNLLSIFFVLAILLVFKVLAHGDVDANNPTTLVEARQIVRSADDAGSFHVDEANPHNHPGNCGHEGFGSIHETIMEKVRVQAKITKQQLHTEKNLYHHHHHHQRRRHLQMLTENCTQIIQTCQQCISIKVNLHLTTFTRSGFELIPHPTPAVVLLSRGERLTIADFSSVAQIQSLFNDTINVVNSAFVGTPFLFVWDSADTTVSNNEAWVDAVGTYQEDMSAAVGSGDLRQLDVFLGFRVNDPAISGTNSVGMSSFASVQQAGTGDGVSLRYDVLAGGGFPGLDGGYHLVHQIGHWLGLLHPYEQFLPETQETGPCNPDEIPFNDFVDDTPMMIGPSDTVVDTSCTEFLNGTLVLDTCPNITGFDPLFNFMYLLDQNSCWEERGEFTCQQIERMYRQWLLFRDPVIAACEDPVQAAELELVFVIDERYVEDQVTIVLYTQNGDELFNSFSDHLAVFNNYPDMTVFEVDLCVPRNEEYLLVVRDNVAGDGFTNGILNIYLEGQLGETLQGNFSESFNTTIQFPERTYTPTTSPSQAPSNAPTISAVPTRSVAPSTSGMPSDTPTFPPSTANPTIAPTDTPGSDRAISPPDSTSGSLGLIMMTSGIVWLCLVILSLEIVC